VRATINWQRFSELMSNPSSNFTFLVPCSDSAAHVRCWVLLVGDARIIWREFLYLNIIPPVSTAIQIMVVLLDTRCVLYPMKLNSKGFTTKENFEKSRFEISPSPLLV
jgi:hypothetical protein